MLSADFRIGAGGFPALPALREAGGQGGGSASFGSLYSQLNAEVGRFIEQGSPSGAGLSPEGLAHRLQAAPASADAPTEPLDAQQQAWLRQIAPQAEAAGRQLGVAPDVLAAQAALESAWGQRPIRREDGSDSHNLFALKAGAGWRGEVAETATTEYEQGVAVRKREGFRSYANRDAAFQDFTRLLLNSPRYQDALQTGSDAQAYGQALQKGGYATDPAYAGKLAQVAAQIRGAR